MVDKGGAGGQVVCDFCSSVDTRRKSKPILIKMIDKYLLLSNLLVEKSEASLSAAPATAYRAESLLNEAGISSLHSDDTLQIHTLLFNSPTGSKLRSCQSIQTV
ncbi:hypothetical protein GOODEAATRI_017133 [Goodea atripinnis]|uniref:Uncharacterized protein n=1 Tax=Goodea atripinnis TaxID=208336 RepID=A0ABV0NXV4_9TELE